MSKRLPVSEKIEAIENALAKISAGEPPDESWTSTAARYEVGRSTLYGWYRSVRMAERESWEDILLTKCGQHRVAQYKPYSPEAYDFFKELCLAGVTAATAFKATGGA